MGVILELFEVIGLVIRWVFKSKFTFNWKKLKELNRDQSNKNLWYGILFCISIVILIIVFGIG